MRLTTSDASFLYMESASGPMHISSILVLDGEVDFQEAFVHLEERLHLMPSYRRKLAQVPMNLAHPTWVDAPDFDLKNHMVEHVLPPDSALDDGISAAVKLNEPMLDRTRPLWMVYMLTGVPGKTLMLHCTHHCMIDGASGVELMAIFYDFDPAGDPLDAKAPAWEPERAPNPMELFNQALDEQMTKLAKIDWQKQMSPPSPERQAAMQRATTLMSEFVTKPAITAPFNAGAIGPGRDLAWMKLSFDEIREVRRALGGTINDVVLTIVSKGVASYLANKGETTENQYMRIMCPVNVRTEDQKGALGNRVSAIFPLLPAWQMPTAQRLNTVIAETERIKQNRDAQALTMMQENAVEPWPIALWPTQFVGTPFDPTQMAANFPAPVLPPAGPRPPTIGYNFTCTNVPGPQVPLYLLGRPITDQIGLLILNGNIGFSTTILSYNKTLFFGFICEPRLLPEVQDISDSAEQAFVNLLDSARARTTELQTR